MERWHLIDQAVLLLTIVLVVMSSICGVLLAWQVVAHDTRDTGYETEWPPPEDR